MVSKSCHLAGYVGAAMALQLYSQKQNNQPLNLTTPYFNNRNQLLSQTLSALKLIKERPSIVILGYKGNAGRGATQLFNECNIPSTYWGRKETSEPSTVKNLNQFSMVINCIASQNTRTPFMTLNDLYRDNKLSILADITCDVSNATHRFPFYSNTTTFRAPCLRIGDKLNPVDVIAIDHLPNWLPLEASHALSTQMYCHLKTLMDAEHKKLPKPWNHAKNKFLETINKEYQP